VRDERNLMVKHAQPTHKEKEKANGGHKKKKIKKAVYHAWRWFSPWVFKYKEGGRCPLELKNPQQKEPTNQDRLTKCFNQLRKTAKPRWEQHITEVLPDKGGGGRCGGKRDYSKKMDLKEIPAHPT